MLPQTFTGTASTGTASASNDAGGVRPSDAGILLRDAGEPVLVPALVMNPGAKWMGIMATVRVIDSHTAGEPTRLVIAGGPDLGEGTLARRAAVFRRRFDWFRSAVVNEPRGSDVVVGALLCPPSDLRCAAGVIFFNNVSFLG